MDVKAWERIQKSFWADPDVIEYLKTVPNQTATINKAIRNLSKSDAPVLEKRVSDLENQVAILKELTSGLRSYG